MPPTCQFYYADNLEKDGTFGQVAEWVWQNAENERHAFGECPIHTSFHVALQLNRREDLIDQAGDTKDRLNWPALGVRDG